MAASIDAWLPYPSPVATERGWGEVSLGRGRVDEPVWRAPP